MAYLVDHFLAPGAAASRASADVAAYFVEFTFAHVLNGEIDAQGEEYDDHWRLIVRDNVVSTEDLGEAEGLEEIEELGETEGLGESEGG